MFFRQIYEKGLAHASYMVGCQKSGTVAVIDAKRDVDTYTDIAQQENLRITKVLETHIHADFLCGSRELQQLTGAEILCSDEGGEEWAYAFPHVGLQDGDQFMIGNIRFDVWHTPGHTPEHISFLVTDTPASDKAIMFFSGDFVFVGDVGRPDLLERAAGFHGTMEPGARQMFHSLQRFKTLPDHIQIHPAHGAGSACGKSLGDIPHSTVGYEKLVNWALQYNDEDAFVSALLAGQPEPPKYFAKMKELNKEARECLCTVIEPQPLSIDSFEQFKAHGAQILDTRDKLSFCDAFIPGSIGIPNTNSLSTWAGWMLRYTEDIVLIASHDALPEICRRLMRIGLDRIVGYIDDISLWTERGHAIATIPWINVDELHQTLSEASLPVLDVRKYSEWSEAHVENAQHIHAGYVTDNLDSIPRDTPIAVMCAGGTRSTIACSALRAAGFHNLFNVRGGFDAWTAAGFAVQRES